LVFYATVRKQLKHLLVALMLTVSVSPAMAFDD
jgi:hypothetical protein